MKIRRIMKIDVTVLAMIAGCLLMASWKVMKVMAQASGQGRELHETYELVPNGTVSVSNPSGSIRVTTWNENRVKVDAYKRVRRDEEIGQVEIQITVRPERIEIRSIYPGRRADGISIDYDLKVPRTALLRSLNSVSGEITVSGPVAQVIARSTSGNVTAREVTETASLSSASGNIGAERIGGELRANSASGSVTVNDAGSRLFAESMSGSVTAIQVRDDATVSAAGNLKLERIGGRAIARSVGGLVSVNDVGGDARVESVGNNVTVTNVRGTVTATAVSGNITIRHVDQGVRAGGVGGGIEVSDAKGRIEINTTGGITLDNIDSRYVLAKSHSGGVKFAGKFYDDGTYDFVSFSGNVTLILPTESSFRLTARTQSGSFNTEFPVQIGGGGGPGFRNGEISGVVGGGGAEVRAASFSGSIYIRKNTSQSRR